MEHIKSACINCTKCPLHLTRNNIVFEDGSETAKIVFIGEAPGQQEDKLGIPFVGRSGQLLDSFFAQNGLSREKNIYITNIVKCRPPENRDPKPDERAACLPYLHQQFGLLSPRIVVCLGRVAAQQLISPTFKVTQEHGQWFEKEGIFYMGMFHPAALLRNPHNKVYAVQDFAILQKKVQEFGLLSS